MNILEETPITFTAAIDRLSATDRGFTFLNSDSGERFCSFADMRSEVARRAALLRVRGVKKGDRVALVLPAPEDFVLTFFALVYAGAIPVPMYPPLSLGKLDSYLEASAKIMQAARCTLAITNKQVEAILWTVVPKVAGLKDLFTCETLFADGLQAHSDAVPASLDDVLFLQFTSGSTADPKGVRVTHRSLFANTHSLLTELHADPKTDHGVSWLPLYHDMGLIGFVLGPLVFEIPITFIPTLRFIKKPTLWLDVLHEKRGTITFAPNFAYALLAKRVRPNEAARWDLSRLKIAGCGAEPIQADTLSRFTETFAASGLEPEAMLPCYGMAEATLAMTFKKFGTLLATDRIDREAYESERRAEPSDETDAIEHVSCGRPFPGHEISIRSESGMALAERSVGEIWFKGPSVADGYDDRPEATEAIFGGGWLRSGDLGYVARGELYICGRKKDLVILNGKNYYPQVIEWALESLTGVRKGNIAVFSVPADGSEALIVACEAKTEDPAALAEAARRLIASEFSLTCKDVVILSSGQLPKTSSGKVQRQKTRALYLSGQLEQTGIRTLGSRAGRTQIAKYFLRSLKSKVSHRMKQLVGQYLGIAKEDRA